MHVREWLNENSTIATIITALLLIAAFSVVYTQLGSNDRGIPEFYFMDLETHEIFTHEDDIPPIVAPSGGHGVRARLYTCGQCTPDEWFGYLETYRDRERAMERYNLDGEFPDDELRVRSLDGEHWMPLNRGESVIEAASKPCPDHADRLPRQCHP